MDCGWLRARRLQPRRGARGRAARRMPSKHSDVERVGALIAARRRRQCRGTGRHDAAAHGRVPRRSANRQLANRTGANAKATNRYGVAPLSLAASSRRRGAGGEAPRGRRRRQHGASRGETALMAAARAGSVDGGEAPSRRRGAASTRTRHWKGQTALMWAAAQDHRGVVQALVAAGATFTRDRKADFRRFCSPRAEVTSRPQCACWRRARM